MKNRDKILDYLIELNIYAVFAVPMFFFGGVELWSQYLAHYLVCSLMVLYFIKCMQKGRIRVVLGRPMLVIAGFLLSILLSTFFSINLNHSLRNIVLLFDGIAVLTVVLSMEKDRKTFERMITVILGIGLLHCIYAIYKPIVIPDSVRGGLYIRGRFFNHNHFVAFVELLFFIPILQLILKRDLPQWKKYFYGISTGVFSLSVLMSISRGGFLSLAITSVFLCLIFFKSRMRIIALSSLFFCQLHSS